MMNAALAAQTGAFDAPFNHRNWMPDGNLYNLSAFPNQPAWDAARNDVAGCAQPPSPAPWIRAMHLVVLPPPLAGRVLVWDGNEGEDPDGAQAWFIVDPARPDDDPDKFWNFNLTGITSGDPMSPPGLPSDLGCAGHTYASDGTLIVLGGTSNLDPLTGTWRAFRFDPTKPPGNGMWTPLPDMLHQRWYPSGVLAWDDAQKERILVPGGTVPDVNVPDSDRYEAFDPRFGQNIWTVWYENGTTPKRLFPTPFESLGQAYFLAYPWLSLLSSGDVYRAGMWQQGAVIHHVDGIGVTMPAPWRARHVTSVQREYGSSVRFPNIDALHTDAIVNIGGRTGGVSLATADICKATATVPGPFASQGWDWTPLAPMRKARVFLNVVILPDASLVAIGGVGNFASPPPPPPEPPEPVLLVERFAGGVWQDDATLPSVRDYHSTAALLPDGTVISAGGDHRCWDYVIYRPPSLTSGKPRPLFTAGPPTIDPATYSTTYTVGYSLPAGSSLAKVVLMRPGSGTHHFDFDQRYVQLPFTIVPPLEGGPPGTSVSFTTPIAPPNPNPPFNSNRSPPGWYMLFLVSNDGVPSLAGWIRLQAPV